MAKSHKSATLPTSLRLNPPPAEENENFFSKLKKKLKFKKVARFNTDVSTGDCENVSVVSFRKTETEEFLKGDESPLAYQVGRSSTRETRSESPKLSKPAARSHSDRYLPNQFVKVSKPDRTSSPRRYRNGDPLMKSSKTDPLRFQNGSKLNRNNCDSIPVYEAPSKSGNEYSSLTFAKDSSVLTQRSQLGHALNFNNDFINQDDSAIDLETYQSGVEPVGDLHNFSDPPVIDESGQNLSNADAFSDSVPGAGRKSLLQDEESVEVPSLQQSSVCDIESCVSNDSQEFDPNYESVQEVREKIARQTGILPTFSNKAQSVDSLNEPGYQSIDDVKNKGTNLMNVREHKLISKSEDSLNEPGYESLNDVKNRISCGQFEKVGHRSEEQADETDSKTGPQNLQDSALGLSTYADGQDTDVFDPVITQEACETKFAGKEDLYSVVNKGNKDTHVQETQDHDKPDCAAEMGEPAVVGEKRVDEVDAYDSEVELSLDPGYAECADAIKGSIVPYSVYSDGSSKISSCTSLDYSVEDFPPEPGYAECADAIKTGAVKKISISYERLVEMVSDVRRQSQEDTTIQHDLTSEIYANPQILLRKKSRLLEDRNSGDFSLGVRGSDNEIGGSIESVNSNNFSVNKVCKPLTAEEEAVEFLPPDTPAPPPLPARNYSIYLDSEEGETIIADELIDSQIEMEDDAFDENEEDVAKESETVECSEKKICENVIDDSKDEETVECNEERMCGSVTVVSNVLTSESEMGDPCLTEDRINQVEVDIDEESESNKETMGHLQVVVKDKFGKENVLTITEKENCTEHQKQRLKSDKGISTSDLRVDSQPNTKVISESNNHCAINKDSDSLPNCKWSKQTEPDCSGVGGAAESAMVITTETVDTNTGTNSEQAYQESAEKASGFQQLCKDTAANCDTFHSTPKCSTNSPASRGQLGLTGVTPVVKISHESDLITNDYAKSKLEVTGRYNRSSGRDDTTTGNVVAEGVVNKNVDENGIAICSSNRMEEINPLPIVANSFLEAVGMLSASVDASKIRMQSISADSDSDECFHTDLPKLEINESDLDDAFHISGEKEAQLFEDISKLTHKESVSDKCSSSVSDSEETKTNSPATVEGVTPSSRADQSTCPVEKSDSIDTTIETPLCVIDTAQGKDVEVGNQIATVEIPEETEGVGETVDGAIPRYCPDYEAEAAAELSDTSPCRTGFPGVPESHQFPDSAVFRMSDSWDNGEDAMYDEACFHDNVPARNPHNYIPDAKAGGLDSSSKCVGHEYEPPPRPPALYSSPQKLDDGKSPSDPAPGEVDFIENIDCPPAIPPRVRVRRQPPPPVSPTQDFMESMRQLKDCGWYWGPLSWSEAEQKLSNKPEGTFLVRDSSDERYILSLSFKSQGYVHHTRIEHHKGNFSFWSQPDSHGKTTIKEFIEQCVTNSRNGRFLYFIRPSGPGSPPMPIHLLNPVSRFAQMRSLQHMCRFRILQMVRRDHIDSLPMPTRMKEYLKEAQYYVEYLDD